MSCRNITSNRHGGSFCPLSTTWPRPPLQRWVKVRTGCLTHFCSLCAAELELSRQLHRQWRLRHVSVSSLGTSVVFSSLRLPALTVRATRNKQAWKGLVVGTGLAPVSRLSPADGQMGLTPISCHQWSPNLPSVSGSTEPISVQTFKPLRCIHWAPTKRGECGFMINISTRVSPFPNLCELLWSLTFAGCALAQQCWPAACRLLKMATANGGRE